MPETKLSRGKLVSELRREGVQFRSAKFSHLDANGGRVYGQRMTFTTNITWDSLQEMQRCAAEYMTWKMAKLVNQGEFPMRTTVVEVDGTGAPTLSPEEKKAKELAKSRAQVQQMSELQTRVMMQALAEKLGVPVEALLGVAQGMTQPTSTGVTEGILEPTEATTETDPEEEVLTLEQLQALPDSVLRYEIIQRGWTREQAEGMDHDMMVLVISENQTPDEDTIFDSQGE